MNEPIRVLYVETRPDVGELAVRALEDENDRLSVETALTIRADPDWLGHLLVNRLQNAVEHGAAGPETNGAATDIPTVTVGDVVG